ncbi:B3 domain-containing transcription factor FUS3 [Linum grandiflorum]
MMMKMNGDDDDDEYDEETEEACWMGTGGRNRAADAITIATDPSGRVRQVGLMTRHPSANHLLLLPSSSSLPPAYGVKRKKRMARQRRRPSTFTRLFSSFITPTTTIPHFSSPHVQPPPPAPAREIDPRSLRFLFQKKLKNSDVSSLRRMVLPKKAAETHLPVLESKEGIPITMYDLDGSHLWSFKYRYWPNNNSRMYVLEKTGDFVNAHGLQLGDFITVYQDCQTHTYVSYQLRMQLSLCVFFLIHHLHTSINHSDNMGQVIQARKASEEENIFADIMKSDHILLQDLAKPNSALYYDHIETSTSAAAAASFSSFIYDSTTTFSNDSPLDFLGGSFTNFPATTDNNFGSLSLDEFY